MGFNEKQLVSSLVDDELSLENSFDQLVADSKLQDTWGRYHLIGEMMRDEANFPGLDISQAVSQAVAQEATVLAPVPKEPAAIHSPSEHNPVADNSNVISLGKKLWQQAGGFAIAASVAMLALYNVPNNEQTASTANIQVALTNVTNAPAVLATQQDNRLELLTMHEMFITHDQLAQQSGNGLPSIHVVSNQKVIPITVNIPMRPTEAKDDAQKELQVPEK